jgi:hypothetical protein
MRFRPLCRRQADNLREFHMRSILLAALAATSFTALPAFAGDTGMVTLKAEQIGQIFCLSRLGNDEAVLDGILTPELKSAIADAERKDGDWAAKNPGEKPPLGDGIPWQAWTDYAAICTVGLTTLMKTDAKVEIAYGFPEDASAGFTDTLILKRVPVAGFDASFWRIDNIAYATGSDLKTELVKAFEGL